MRKKSMVLPAIRAMVSAGGHSQYREDGGAYADGEHALPVYVAVVHGIVLFLDFRIFILLNNIAM